MADQGSLSARDVHIQWSFALPGLQVCQFEGGQEASWFSESLLSPCCVSFLSDWRDAILSGSWSGH